MRWPLALAALALAGCGDRARDRTAFAIDLTDTGLFVPATSRIPLGASVVFRNMGTQPREVSSRPGTVAAAQARPAAAPDLTPQPPPPVNAAPWRSGVLYPGETWSHTFTRAGAYLFESPYAPGFSGTPSVGSGMPDSRQGRSTGQLPTQTPVGVITVEPAGSGPPREHE